MFWFLFDFSFVPAELGQCLLLWVSSLYRFSVHDFLLLLDFPVRWYEMNLIVVASHLGSQTHHGRRDWTVPTMDYLSLFHCHDLSSVEVASGVAVVPATDVIVSVVLNSIVGSALPWITDCCSGHHHTDLYRHGAGDTPMSPTLLFTRLPSYSSVSLVGWTKLSDEIQKWQ